MMDGEDVAGTGCISFKDTCIISQAHLSKRQQILARKRKNSSLEDVNDMTIINFSFPHTLQRKYKLDN
jgi:hypothetical protein